MLPATFVRSACTSLMSHSLKVVRMAAVCCAMTSCAAILRRSGDIFLRVKRSFAARAPVASGTALFPRARRFLIVGRSFARFCSQPRDDVAFRYPPALSGAANLLRIEFFFGDHSPDRWRKDRPHWANAWQARLLQPAPARLADAGLGLLCREQSPCHRSSPPLRRSSLPAPSATRVSRTPSFSAVISVETLSVSRVKSGFAGFDVFARFLVPDGNDAAGDRFADRRNFDFDAHEGVTLCAIEVQSSVIGK